MTYDTFTQNMFTFDKQAWWPEPEYTPEDEGYETYEYRNR